MNRLQKTRHSRYGVVLSVVESDSVSGPLMLEGNKSVKMAGLSPPSGCEPMYSANGTSAMAVKISISHLWLDLIISSPLELTDEVEMENVTL
ncbi:hypothetical protein [Paenibacillus prosopidis]|uniref:hypothetical protein n=1 Tax=Paenibacillus prosopidis TaxID=630520 RepID=UPI000DF13F74|nr:hypothetical protein [Paenibacillus prosopidis]